jgi:hypothetical protein
LAGDDGRAGADAIVEDLEQIAARRLVERIEPSRRLMLRSTLIDLCGEIRQLLAVRNCQHN